MEMQRKRSCERRQSLAEGNWQALITGYAVRECVVVLVKPMPDAMGVSSGVAPSLELLRKLWASEVGEMACGVRHGDIRNDEVDAVNLVKKRLKPRNVWDIFDSRHAEQLRRIEHGSG